MITEAISQLLLVDYVETVDLIDRFCPDLSIGSTLLQRKGLPDGSFDAATLNNALHHVPVEERTGLMREIRHVASGPLYLKDHVSRGLVDVGLLMLLDAIGNIPFGVKISAQYLTDPEWKTLAAERGWCIGECVPIESYRAGAFAFFFPKRLGSLYRLEPV
ncbi:MAG TPA: class I SAM-dependent methyltransferase [Alphaproteobacteria bacterium]|nr:class I SAM-dependent methyltransferase [Alphaproteobacteria bacterium]